MASLIIRRKGKYIVVEVSFKEALKRRLERYLMKGESTSGVYFYGFAVLRCGGSELRRPFYVFVGRQRKGSFSAVVIYPGSLTWRNLMWRFVVQTLR